MRRSDFWSDDESDLATFEFFIEHERVENFRSRKVRRQSCWQLKLLQKIDNRIAILFRQTDFYIRNFAGGYHSEADRVAVGDSLIVNRALDPVPNCVTEIQQRALAF